MAECAVCGKEYNDTVAFVMLYMCALCGSDVCGKCVSRGGNMNRGLYCKTCVNERLAEIHKKEGK